MQTVFSYIIQKRFSLVNENVATDALTYILESSDATQRGMNKLLRGIIPDLPLLNFKSQQSESGIRPDMWGYADTEPRVFIENKFWAGLTDNQPVSYMQQLLNFTQPTLLLVIAPAAREQTLWRELMKRLYDAGTSGSEGETAAGIYSCFLTTPGPIIAITSWSSVLSVLEHEAVDDPNARGDLIQLRALCVSADNEAFTPISKMELSDQQLPAFILQINSMVQEMVDISVTKNVLSVAGLRPQASWDRIGRYVWLSGVKGVGAWIGIHFVLWKSHGITPLWLIFSEGDYGRAQEVRPLIEPWAAKMGVLTASTDQGFALALEIQTGEEKTSVIRSLTDTIKEISELFINLPPKSVQNNSQD